jgi:hypothetical protein
MALLTKTFIEMSRVLFDSHHVYKKGNVKRLVIPVSNFSLSSLPLTSKADPERKGD